MVSASVFRDQSLHGRVGLKSLLLTVGGAEPDGLVT